MRTRLLQIASILRLTRISTVFAAVANVWFVVLWSRADQSGEKPSGVLSAEPLWVSLLGGALVAGGLYAFGTCLNDIFDYHRDQQLKPSRPLVSGNISVDTAVISTAVTMIVAILGAAVFGTVGVMLTLGLLVAILAFNATGKFIPGLGLFLLGLIYAGYMLVPNIDLRFVWPVWLAMTHGLMVAGLAHVLGRKTPAMTPRAVAFAGTGWVLWSVVLFALPTEGNGSRFSTPLAHGVIGPLACLLLAALFGVNVYRRLRALGPGPRLAEKIHRHGTIWLALYACAWLLGSGLYAEGAIMCGLTLAGILGMSAMRELYGLVENPVGYRR
ncbi:MAG: hypothetical protein D6695_09470 [Planctomycetota bacterium]|nr:MAG: hypothetical protein D6695_09470 [Planctomycetota bacterium]